MFLGIRYNVWHAILVQPVVSAVFTLVWFGLRGDISDPWLFLWGLLAGMVIAHHLQSWNEARQAIDPEVEVKYGSYLRFQLNSRDDWRWFWRGLFISWAGPVIIVLTWG